MEADDPGRARGAARPGRAAGRRRPRAIERAGALLGAAERPVIMAGTDLYWGHGERALRELSEALGIPVFLNGLARGCLPADHPNFFSRARSAALKGADVALVIGVPMDFRLGFGGSFGEDTQIVADRRAPTRDRAAPRELAGELYGGLPATLSALREAALDAGGSAEAHRRAGATACARPRTRSAPPSASSSTTTARRCTRCASTRSSIDVLDRDAIVIGDGGDFVSYAGRVMRDLRARLLARPGPVRLPRVRARATRSRPRSRVPTGRSACCSATARSASPGMEFDTMVRHGLPVVAVIGNNGIWALEKHPMEFLYGYSVAAELRPETRYDQVVEALGGHGELVAASRRSCGRRSSAPSRRASPPA